MAVFALKLAGFAGHAFSRLCALLMPAEGDPPDYRFSAADIGQLHRLGSAPGTVALDDQTWSDLMLDRYSEELCAQTSIFGRQVVHQRLRAGLDDDACAQLGERLGRLMQDPSQLDAVHRTLRPLRGADTEVAELLFERVRPVPPSWAGRTWPLPLGLLASLAAVAVSPWAWLGTGLALYLLIAIQMRYHERMQAWERSLHALQMLLRVHSILGASGNPDFMDGCEEAGRLNRSLSRSLVSNVPGGREYADWFLLANVKHYFRTVDLVFAQRDFLRDCYLRCANLEADVALARHLLATPSWCRAERSAARTLVLDQAVHPLLAHGTPLSISLAEKGAFISGQNGIGKSTFLRTVGLNLAAARAFGFCYARHARLPAVPVWASMQNEDSLLGGESLYMAELRRARELLAVADSAQPAVYLIDEIFRGTNHVESVAAAAAVLDSLAAHGTVIVSSHNLVLAPLLAHRLHAYCISERAGKLELRPGVLAHTNGIALLAAHGFGQQVQDKAGKVADWLAGYLGQPSADAGVLAESGR